MLRDWQELARRTRSLLGSAYGVGENAPSASSDYYFGASYSDSQVLPPPTVLHTKLPIRQGLRLLAHADPTFMAMHGLKKQFETMFGVPIKNKTLSIDRLRNEILENTQQLVSSHDLIACDLPWFGEMADAGHFLCLDDMMAESHFDSSDFHNEALASARYKGKQYGVPVQTTPELLVYRRDVFEANGLQPPSTVSETLNAARKVHDPFSGGMSGIAWNAARGTPLGHTFRFVMAAFGKPVINLEKNATGFNGESVNGEQFRPNFNSAEARGTAEYLLELLQYSPRGILNMSWYERARCYADGNAAIAYCATLLAPLFELDDSSPAYKNTQYLPHPRGPKGRNIAPIGGYALAIPSNVASERIEPIWIALLSHPYPA